MGAASAIREAMDRSGMSKKALCEAAGISRSSLDSYLKGERQPSVAQLERIGEAAGLRMDISWEPARLDLKPNPSWLIPDNPSMRPQPMSVEQRASVLVMVTEVAMQQQRRPRGPLEMPPFKTLGRQR